MNVTYTNGAGFFGSSALTGSNQSTGVYTLVADNEIIHLKVPGAEENLKINSITITAQATALIIVPNGLTEYGFIYIGANSSKVIQVGAINSIQVLNSVGATIYFEATWI